jgi:hypothetical protein
MRSRNRRLETNEFQPATPLAKFSPTAQDSGTEQSMGVNGTESKNQPLSTTATTREFGSNAEDRRSALGYIPTAPAEAPL